MNDKFTAEEISVLRHKGWDIEDGDTCAYLGGLSKLNKCNGQFNRFGWRPSEHKDEDGRWSLWADFTYVTVNDVDDYGNHTD